MSDVSNDWYGPTNDVARTFVTQIGKALVVMRQGKVTGVTAGPPRSVAAVVDGVTITGIRIMDHVDPVINEGVWIIDMGSGRWLIVGVAGQTFTRAQFVKSNGDTMTGKLTVNAGGNETIKLATDGSYIAWYDSAGTTRRGYLQGTNTGMYLGTDIGSISLVGATSVSGALSANAGINCFTVLRQGGTDEGGQIDLQGGTSYSNMTVDQWQQFLRLMYNGNVFQAFYRNPSSGSCVFINNMYGEYNAQIATQRNGGSGGLRATGNSYYEASIYAGPGDIAEAQSGKTASIAFHPGGVAPQLRVGYNDSQIYNRAADGLTNNPFTASAFNVASTRRIKKNITTWPSLSMSSAVESAATRLAQLRVVTFDRAEGHKKQLPTGRRLEAWKRLNNYTTANGLPPYELPDHDCAVHDCDGTESDPCSFSLNTNHVEYGFIAEEVHEVFPEAVVVDADKIPSSINYSMITAIVAAAVQEHTSQIRQLTERIELLEERLKAAGVAGVK